MSLINFMGYPVLTGWDANSFLANVRKNLIAWGRVLMMIVGVAMVIVGIFKIAQGLISHGKTQVSWVTNILLICVGAMFCAGSVFFNMMTQSSGGVGGGLANELNKLGH